MNWQVAGIALCVFLTGVCAVGVVIESYRIHKLAKRRIHRGPFKDYKRNNVEAVP